MREHTLVIQDPLRNGLRQYKEMTSGNIGNFLSDLYGLVPGEFGLEQPNDFDNFAPELSRSFPFPMVFHGTEGEIVVGQDYIRIGTILPVYDMEDNEVSFTFTDVPHHVDLGRSWVITDGNIVLFRQNPEGSLGPIRCLSDPKVSSACYHMGRVLIGGSSNVNNMWAEDSKRLVFWSTIGGGDAFEPFLGELSPGGEGFSFEAFRVLDQNLAGWCNPGVGEVLRLFPLNRNVIVFGTEGIAVLTYHREGPGAYGQAKILDLGIMDRNAVSGGPSIVFFIDFRGDLWRLTSEMELQKLGYKEFLSSLSSIVLTYVEGFRELYLTDGDTSYVLNPNGLARIGLVISSVLPKSKKYYATKFQEHDENFSLTIGGLDFARAYDRQVTILPGYKKLTYIHVGGEGLSQVYVSTTTIEQDGTLFPGQSKPCNDNMVVFCGTSGRQFKILFEGKKTLSQTNINAVTVRYQNADGSSYRSL